MPVIVQKFGGSSLASADHVRRVARRVDAAARAGDQVCVIVSAMGSTTDELLALAASASPAPDTRELDMLLATGEQASTAVLAMALGALGRPAVSLTGAQAGIATDGRHGCARIAAVRPDRIRDELRARRIPIVAGFQGLGPDGELTTLGRGGSDTTAVALAAALAADRCEIYTDVDGVLTGDPRVVSTARRLPAVGYEEMLELSTRGAKVLAGRSVECAQRHRVPITVRSSLADGPGTLVGGPDDPLEQTVIAGVAHDMGAARVTVLEAPRRTATVSLLRALAEEGIDVDMIVQNLPVGGRADLSFTVPEADLGRTEAIISDMAERLGCGGVVTDPDVGRVSVVGAGMTGNPGVATEVFNTMAAEGIEIELIATSSISISCLVRAADVPRAVQAVHDAFDLGGASPAERAPQAGVAG